MDTEKDTTIQIKRLANNSEYFNNVFKKTEKLVSVIFYMLSHINTNKDNETYKSLLKDKALCAHEVSLLTLRLQTQEAAVGLLDFQFALVDLESTLRVAEASGVIPQNISIMLFEQLITVERYLSNNYVKQVSLDLAQGDTILGMFDTKSSSRGSTASRALPKPKTTAAPTPRRRPVNIPQNDISSDAYFVYSQLTDRAERIKTVLEAKPNATIKDISDIITDVSEKTIQRELNSLIEKGQVVREGERRWSRYSVYK